MFCLRPDRRKEEISSKEAVKSVSSHTGVLLKREAGKRRGTCRCSPDLELKENRLAEGSTVPIRDGKEARRAGQPEDLPVCASVHLDCLRRLEVKE